MSDFWKAAAIVLLTVILGSSIGKNEKELAVLLNLAACCVIGIIAIKNLSPVIDYLWQLNAEECDSSGFTGILMRISGAAIGTELVGMIASDAGNSSLTKVMRLLGTSVILSISLPMFESLFKLVQEIFRIL